MAKAKRENISSPASMVTAFLLFAYGVISLYGLLVIAGAAAGPGNLFKPAPAQQTARLPSGGGRALFKPVKPAPVFQEAVGEGQAIFKERCIACHTIGGGPLVGPDLEGVVERRERDWLIRWISEPDKMLAEEDALATQLLAEFNGVPMPNLGLSETQVEALVAYLAAPGGGTGATAAPQTAAMASGGPQAGQSLFTGQIALQNGGPACISCHSVSGVGALGGGTLGPDLTRVYERYGDTGLAAALQNLPFPTMQGVFSEKPLTEAEAADLYAYFTGANARAAQPVDFAFAWIGLGGFVLFVGSSHFIWKKRLSGVRIPLVGR